MTTLLEKHSIDFIPLDQRHGRARSLFPVWFSADMELPVIAAGVAAVAGGASIGWAIVGIVLGALLGGLLMAYHSAQGPSLGLPQMIQSRAQFGYYGASFPLILVVGIYLGFYAAGAVLGAQALTALTGVPLAWSIVIMGALSVSITIAGYDVIHTVMRYLAYFLGAVFLVLSMTYAVTPHAPGHAASGFSIGPFLAAGTVAAMSQLGYAPYVADYSRYLPTQTSVRATFRWTYAGVSISGIWLMILGAVLQYSFPALGPMAAVHGLAAHIGPWFPSVATWR